MSPVYGTRSNIKAQIFITELGPSSRPRSEMAVVRLRNGQAKRRVWVWQQMTDASQERWCKLMDWLTEHNGIGTVCGVYYWYYVWEPENV